MGYRSDVVRLAVLESEAHADEVMAAYSMDMLVQHHNCAKDWRRKTLPDGKALIYYHGENVKWYESYEDVQAMEHMLTVLQQFCENRWLSYAFGMAHVGENYEDVDYEVSRDGDKGDDLSDVVYDLMELRRSVHLHIDPEEDKPA